MSANDVIPQEQIPAWMTQAQRGVDWGALIIIGFCLIASWSFLTQSQLPAYNDTEHYVYQISDYHEAFEAGIIYSRWSPYAVYGYGAPIPHYYPSGTAYIGGLISYLFTNDALLATRLLYIFSIILAGSMTYHFVKQWTSALSGMIASLIYIFSPYVMFTVPHIEGDLSLSLGISLLPSLLWAVSRFLKRNQAFDMMLLAFIIALIIFIIPEILMQGFIAIMILMSIEFRQGIKRHLLLSILGAVGIGLLLTSFYWLPAFVQYNDIEWYTALIEAPRYQLVFNNLFIASQPVDAGLMIPHPVYTLGWGLLFILPMSLIALIIKRENRLFCLSFLGFGLFILFMVLFFFPEQTSWFTLIMLCLAIASSYHGQDITSFKTLQLSSVWFSILVIIGSSMPTWVIPEPELSIQSYSSTDQIQHQQLGYGYAGLPSGLALPSHLPLITAQEMPLNMVEENGSRFRSNLGVEATALEESAYLGRYNVNTNTTTNIEYYRAYFQNWQAISNRGNLSITESSNHLMLINFPSDTETTITLRIGFTLITTIAWTISIGAIFLCSFFWWYRWRIDEANYDTSILLADRSSRILTIILILFMILRYLAPSIPIHLFNPPAQYSMTSSLFVRTNFDGNFQLLAYHIPQQNYRSGQQVQVTAYWTLNSSVNSHYLVQLRLTDESRQITYYESGYSHAGYYPSNRWLVSGIVPQEFIFRIPALQSEYFITFDVYECMSACSIEVMDTNEAQGQIPILRPIIVD